LNFLRIFLAALAALVVYIAFGGVAFAAIPLLKTEFLKYPAVYRDQNGQMSHMPIGMLGMFLSMVALSVLYAYTYRGGPGLAAGARFGAIVGIFALGAFVLHNYVNLNVGLVLILQQCVMYFIQWTLVGIVIGLIYRPALAQ
jgi:hypothetical protein